jgi:hypothetical protein
MGWRIFKRSGHPFASGKCDKTKHLDRLSDIVESENALECRKFIAKERGGAGAVTYLLVVGTFGDWGETPAPA